MDDLQKFQFFSLFLINCWLTDGITNQEFPAFNFLYI